MSVEVDYRALQAYANVLTQYKADAEFLKAYLERTVFNPIATSGVTMPYLVQMNALVLIETMGRLGHMIRISEGSVVGLDRAAEFYQRTDKETRERLERTYDAPDYTAGDPPPSQKGDPLVEIYPNSITMLIAEVEKRDEGDDLGIRHSEVQKEMDFWANLPSPAYWVREAIKKMTGTDVVEELIQFLHGDWEAWIEATKAWRRVAEAVSSMEQDQLMQYTNLDDYWNGKAYSAAVAYFHKFALASEREVGYYEYMFRHYKEMAEYLFSAGQALIDIVQFIFDQVVTLGIANLFKTAAGANALWDALDVFTKTLTLAKQGLEGSADEARGNIPPCELAAIATAYDHPDKNA